MIEYRILTHADYDDIVDISKDIWDGEDYLPEVFHAWVDDPGVFLGAVDTDTGKVIGTDKLTVLPEGTGWLEGLRVHKDYQGQGLGRDLAYRLLGIAMEQLQEGKLKDLAFSTHISAVQSISLMKKVGFRLAQAYKLISRPLEKLPSDMATSNFDVKPWNISYEEFANLPYLKRRDNLLPLTFYFQEPTQALYDSLRLSNCFVEINGHKGIYKLKGEPHFIAVEETFEAVDTYMTYYQLLLKGKNLPSVLTSIKEEDEALIHKLQEAGYSSWENWTSDYLYFVYKSSY